MVELFVLALIAVGALAVAMIVGMVIMAIKVVLWIVLLPFRILGWLLWIPISLTLGALGLVAGVVLAPIVVALVAGFIVISLIGAVLSLMLPLVPFVLLGLLLWAIFRHRPAVAG
jgi:hypothetical protein